MSVDRIFAGQMNFSGFFGADPNCCPAYRPYLGHAPKYYVGPEPSIGPALHGLRDISQKMQGGKKWGRNGEFFYTI